MLQKSTPLEQFIEALAYPAKDLLNGSRVGDQGHLLAGWHHLAIAYICWRIIVPADLEPSRAPVNKIDSAISLELVYCFV